jgi:hypothetical protein
MDEALANKEPKYVFIIPFYYNVRNLPILEL